jgi:hypothetical protein
MMTTLGYVLVAIVGLLAFGGFTSFVASEKGYSGGLWFWLGLLFNLAALIAASGLPKKT